MRTEPRTYKSKPVQVQAIEWNGGSKLLKFLKEWGEGRIKPVTHNLLQVDTGMKYERIALNDYIIKHPNGRFEVLSPEAFAESYELAEWEYDRESDMWEEQDKEP